MELINIKQLTNIDKSNADILTYEKLKKLPCIEITNNLEVTNNSKQLLGKYISDNLCLVPVKRISSQFQEKENFPSRVLLEMTSNCNLSCTMCPRNHLTREKMDIDSHLFKKCVDELETIGIDGLWIYNIGESLLHKNFQGLVNYVSQKKNLGPIWLSSNGLDLNNNFAEIIINSNIHFMNLSINATSQEVYDKISPTGNWNQTIQNFHNFLNKKITSKNKKPFTRVQIIDQKYACNEIDQFLNKYSQLADIISVNTLEAFSQDEQNNLEYASIRERPHKKKCNRVKRKDLFIFSNGETTFCDTDFNGQFSLGNVKDKSISQIWNSDIRKKFINYNEDERLNEIELCKNCLDYDL